MQLKTGTTRSLWTRLLFGTVIAGLLAFVSTPRLRADEEECRKRIVKADHHLHDAVEHHGWDSKEAEHARAELHEARDYCWSHYHKWWDEDAQRWHTDHDWDDHDHDHPH